MSGLAGKLLTIVQQRTGLPRLWSDLRTGPIRGWKRNRPQGKIERIEGGSVVGWLWNPAIPEQAMEFRHRHQNKPGWIFLHRAYVNRKTSDG